LSDRITQVAIETSIAPTDSKVRVTQVAVETSTAPTDSKVSVTQLAIETSVAPTDGKVRVTQIAVETSIQVISVFQCFQLGREVLIIPGGTGKGFSIGFVTG
jgi:hypothetical protein